jgi:putative ATP-dependent endonuclease of OLD family
LDLDRAGATIVEVGGKRNLPEFAKLATSFNIPTGILYDEDSSDFKDNQEEEAVFNAQLDAFGRSDGTVRVWRIPKTYEDNLRKVVGEAQYQAMCQKYAKTGKPTRARLIATEQGLPIPVPLEDVLRWLANKPAGVSSKGS